MRKPHEERKLKRCWPYDNYKKEKSEKERDELKGFSEKKKHKNGSGRREIKRVYLEEESERAREPKQNDW